METNTKMMNFTVHNLHLISFRVIESGCDEHKGKNQLENLDVNGRVIFE